MRGKEQGAFVLTLEEPAMQKVWLVVVAVVVVVGMMIGAIVWWVNRDEKPTPTPAAPTPSSDNGDAADDADKEDTKGPTPAKPSGPPIPPVPPVHPIKPDDPTPPPAPSKPEEPPTPPPVPVDCEFTSSAWTPYACGEGVPCTNLRTNTITKPAANGGKPCPPANESCQCLSMHCLQGGGC